MIVGFLRKMEGWDYSPRTNGKFEWKERKKGLDRLR